MKVTNKSNHIQSAMRYHKIVFLIVACLVVLGFYSMTQMNKDEFPQFTIRQGVVAAVYPGASAKEVEEQVTKPLENFLFTYEEIDKETYINLRRCFIRRTEHVDKKSD